MKEYLQEKLNQKVGVIRAGMPREVYFEAVLKRLLDTAAVFEDAEGHELALSFDKILLIGPPEAEPGRPGAGFRRSEEGPGNG
jgi:hypothetical protein